MSVCHLSLSTD